MPITTIGVDQKVLGSDVAAALVGAAMLCVLLLPLLAMRVRRRAGRAKPAPRTSAESEAW